MTCTCRNCNAQYDHNASRSEVRGYCSQACAKAKAELLGLDPSKRLGPFSTLKQAGQEGYLPVEGAKT
jgi:hypothetical protein